MAPQGINEETLVPWLEAHVPGLTPPLEFVLVAGGRSNLTFQVTDARGGRYVLRRPPLGHVLATAHDMGREHRIIAALGPTSVPVPPALAFCDDEAVNGAPFYVMAFVDGHIIRDAASAEQALTPEQRRTAAESLVDVLAEIHAVDVDAVGLGDLGRREGYIERQLSRWYKQYGQSKSREIPAIDEVYQRLSSRIPQQGAPTIVHGDYRLDNCMIGHDGTVAAVLDWELCTLGDPLADVGLLMVYWNDPEDDHPALLAAATTTEGFPRRKELLDRYGERTGRDLGGIDFYVAFGYWKLACILDGVYARYKHGAMGNDGADFEAFAVQVERLAQTAEEAAARIP